MVIVGIARVVAGVAPLAGLSVTPGAAGAEDKAVAELRRPIDSRFAGKIEWLAKRCDELTAADNGLDLRSEAELTRRWPIPREPAHRFLVTGRSVPPPPRANDFWRNKIGEYRREYAAELFEAARRLHTDGQEAAAYRLLHEVLREDPEHEAAVAMLGPPAANRPSSRKGTAALELAGWRARGYDMIESPHFLVLTNAGAKEGIGLSGQLEDLHDIWKQVFFDYWAPLSGARLAFDPPSAPRLASRQFRVILFRDRDEYQAAVRRLASDLPPTEGFYSDTHGVTFLYAGGEESQAAAVHEVTHQLFQEIGETPPEAGKAPNTWLIEGIALYMESLIEHDGFFTLGGFDARRLQFARTRRLAEGFFVPLPAFCRLDREAIAADENIEALYAQGAGWTHFLMDGEDGRHRGAMMKLLALIYRGRPAADSLAELTGLSLDELDEAHLTFLRDVDDEDLSHLLPPPHVSRLSLGFTKVTDRGLASLKEHRELTDLSLAVTAVTDDGLAEIAGLSKLEALWLPGCDITDAGAERIAELTALEVLNLERTKVGDAGAAHLARLTRLEQLDLSHTPITDAAIARLSRLENLRVLYLTGTGVTDSCVNDLKRLRNLEYLNVKDTAIKTDTVEELKRSLPSLDVER